MVDPNLDAKPQEQPDAAPAKHGKRFSIRKANYTSVLRKYGYIIVLILIVVMAYQMREIPNRFGVLPDIDTYYIYRMGELILSNNLQLPEVDTLRNFPMGDTQFDRSGALFIPPLTYLALNPFLGMSFFEFSFIFPSMMGALAVLIMFFVGKEIFNSRTAGLFSSFFLATVIAFFIRTSTGEIEKEATSAPFMFLSFLFFVKSFKECSWKYGILSGLFLGITGSVWGGVQIVFLLYAIFAFVLLLFNQGVRNLALSYIPTIGFGLGIDVVFAGRFDSQLNMFLPTGVAVLILICYLVEKVKIVGEKQIKFVPLGLTIIFILAFLAGSMFIDTFSSLLNTLIDRITLKVDTTVAESIPGNWDTVLGSTGITYTALPSLESLNPLFSIWLLYTLGSIVIVYKLLKSRNTILVFPLAFLVLSIQTVFFGVRFTYMLGVPAALLAGFFVSWLLKKGSSINTWRNVKATWVLYAIFGVVMLLGAFVSSSNIIFFTGYLAAAAALIVISVLTIKSEGKESVFKRIYASISGKLPSGRFDLLLIPVIIFIALTVALNAENARAHAGVLGPSINQPFLDSMEYLRTQTPEGSSVFSWWDFGYWFQTVGQRPTILDGGGAGAISRYDAALFFIDSPENWDNWKPTLISNVSYILMDWTLPGKFGAITHIASGGQNVQGFIQFSPQPNVIPNEDVIIYEYSANPYMLWLPTSTDSEPGSLRLADTPFLLVSQNGQIINKAAINNICTQSGITTVGNRTDSIEGCAAITSHGIYFIPGESMDTMFSRLMFMDGAGLPVEKVFDNSVIKIYKVYNV